MAVAHGCVERQAPELTHINTQAKGPGVQQVGAALRDLAGKAAAVGELILLDPTIERRIVRVVTGITLLFMGWLGYQVFRLVGEGAL